MRRVRTAVTIPDDVYAAGERLARILTLTRSQLYADALAAYLAREDELVTDRLIASRMIRNAPTRDLMSSWPRRAVPLLSE
jgi:metal-responsive CopG/Arc/MetJ family transcriptional regulator